MASFKLRVVNSSDFVGRSIDWVTNSLWDHVEIEDEDGRWIAAHAGSGVGIFPADYAKPTRERRYSIPCTDEQYAKAMAYARSKVGTPYDYLDIVGLLFHDRSIHSKEREICSMFVFESAWAAGIQMLNVLPGYTQLVTPETLHLSPLLIGRCTYEFPSS
jgi:uncharacterized protein YycO